MERGHVGQLRGGLATRRERERERKRAKERGGLATRRARLRPLVAELASALLAAPAPRSSKREAKERRKLLSFASPRQ
jgi:hypothetical protein